MGQCQDGNREKSDLWGKPRDVLWLLVRENNAKFPSSHFKWMLGMMTNFKPNVMIIVNQYLCFSCSIHYSSQSFHHFFPSHPKYVGIMCFIKQCDCRLLPFPFPPGIILDKMPFADLRLDHAWGCASRQQVGSQIGTAS